MSWQDFTQLTVLSKAGDNFASASPTSDASANLISAATNINGIIITGVSISVTVDASSLNHSPYLRLLVNGVIQLENVHRVLTGDAVTLIMGGLCAIEVPAGQAVSYESSLHGMTGLYHGHIRVSWRHKAS